MNTNRIKALLLSAIMADPEDSNTVLYFDVDNKNSIIKE